MNITMTREEIRDTLDVSENTLKAIIKRKTLCDRLKDVGLELLNEFKYGRSTIYEVSPIKLDYWDEVQQHYNVRKREEHTVYTHARLDGGMEKSRSCIIRETNIDISGNTAKKFDDILENEGVIAMSKPIYMLYNKENDAFKEITEREYLVFWKEVKYCRELMSDNKKKLDRYEISEDTYDLRTWIILDSIGKEKGEIAIKFNTYRELIDTKELISMLENKIK